MGKFKLTSAYTDLFGEVHYETSPAATQKTKPRKWKSYSLDLKKIPTPLSISIDDIQGYPEYSGDVPTGLIGFNECLSSTDYSRTVHFYLYDSEFIRILRHPENYLVRLGRFPSAIAPDFSVRVGMSEEEMLYSIAASRAVANYLYDNGIKVIPNVQWSLPDLYDVCFANIPKHSTVAVNCMGIIGLHASKYLWRKGYGEMLQRLDPSCIIRYGDKMPGEDESRSVYFPNERIIRMRGGSHGR